MRFSEYSAKSLIQASKIPSIDFVANPYTGCDFGCAYCYASFSGRFVGQPVKEWGNFVAVKSNAVELVQKELAKMSEKKKSGTILLSSVTDPYMGIEKKREITRGILSALVEHSWTGIVRILTKSPIVTRDIDLLKQLPKSEVGLTVTTTDDTISRWLEVRAPSATRRLRTLPELHDAGIRTFAFVGPLLPHFAERPDLLDALFEQLAATGVREVYMEHINLKRYITERMNAVLENEPEAVKAAYKTAKKSDHRKKMDEIVAPLLVKHGLKLRFDEVIFHDEFQEKHA